MARLGAARVRRTPVGSSVRRHPKASGRLPREGSLLFTVPLLVPPHRRDRRPQEGDQQSGQDAAARPGGGGAASPGCPTKGTRKSVRGEIPSSAQRGEIVRDAAQPHAVLLWDALGGGIDQLKVALAPGPCACRTCSPPSAPHAAKAASASLAGFSGRVRHVPASGGPLSAPPRGVRSFGRPRSGAVVPPAIQKGQAKDLAKADKMATRRTPQEQVPNGLAQASLTPAKSRHPGRLLERPEQQKPQVTTNVT